MEGPRNAMTDNMRKNVGKQSMMSTNRMRIASVTPP
jgi:hypothetical protein